MSNNLEHVSKAIKSPSEAIYKNREITRAQKSKRHTVHTPWILKFGKDNLVELTQRQVLYPKSAWEHRVKSGPNRLSTKVQDHTSEEIAAAQCLTTSSSLQGAPPIVRWSPCYVIKLLCCSFVVATLPVCPRGLDLHLWPLPTLTVCIGTERLDN